MHQPRFHGPGAEQLSLCDTSRRDCSRRELCPNPLSSDTSCREVVVRTGGTPRSPGALETPVTHSPCDPCFRTSHNGRRDHPLSWEIGTRIPQNGTSTREGRFRRHHPGPRAALPQLPRRSRGSANPRCLPSTSCPAGVGLLPLVVTNEWEWADAFSTSTVSLCP